MLFMERILFNKNVCFYRGITLTESMFEPKSFGSNIILNHQLS